MKKIFIIAQVKNEADIIESFCRYNLTYSDGMLIRDNGSSDNTKKIIQSLINEGLPIYWADDIFTKYPGMKGRDAYARKAIDEYDADLIISLDADEFLYHTDGINPRETLEALREDVEYQVLWRTYVYEKEPDIKLGFMPNNFTQYRNPVLEKVQGHAGKTFISKYLIQEKNAQFVGGAHWLVYPEENKDTIIIENPKKLVCAHFPVRSKSQIIRKSIPNWITKWSTTNRVPRDILDNFQLGILFNILRNNGDISVEEMKKHSVDYSIYNLSQDVQGIQKTIRNLQEKGHLTKKGSMDVSFCSAKLKLRYTDYKENNKVFMRAVLTEIDKAIMFLSTESDEKSKLIKKYLPVSTSFVFLDTGKGFNPKEVFQVPLFRHENYFEATITLPQNVKSIRFDPVEDFACILDNVQIVTDVGKIEYTPINGTVTDGINTFDNLDPQIFIDFKGKNISRLQITGNMRHFIIDDISFLSKIKKVFENFIEICQQRDGLIAERNNLTAERDGLIAERNNLTAERDGLIAERNNLTAERDGLINSLSWRITKPLRLFKKGLLSIKTYGIKETFKQIKIYKKKQMHEPLSFFETNTLLTLPDRLSQKNTAFPKKIKISIITPLYNTPEQFLKEMIQSVKEQTYNNWELCLADGSDYKNKNIKRICKNFVRYDKRIKYKRLNKNFGISGNSNKAIEMSKGEYIGLLDHDDVLHPSALFEVMKIICNENADFIYTDEATFTNEDNKITLKHYKPDYAIDTLRSCNYICHFTVFSRKLMEQAGAFRSEFDGSQDYDLVLRYTDIASKIYHIPKLLYFWRSYENSVASNIDNKSYAITAAKNAIMEHLARHGISAKIESTKVNSSYYKIIYDLTECPLVSIIIPNKDHVPILQKCLSSIKEKTTYSNYEIIIVENNSIEDITFAYYEELKRQTNIHVVYWEEKGFNYSKINNYGVQYAHGQHLVFLNNDVEIITPNWIEEMLMFSQRSDVGAVGIKLYFPDDTIQHAGVIVGIGGIAGHIYPGAPRDTIGYMGRLHIVQNMSAVTAACMMIKKSIFDEVGGFPPEFYASWNDVDLCLKIRATGYLIVWTPFAEAYHHESKTRGYPDTPEKQREFAKEIDLFKTKWGKELAAVDPYFNCNFSPNRADYYIK